VGGVAAIIRLIVEVEGHFLRASAQPVRDQAAQKDIPLLLEFGDAGWGQLLGQMTTHSIGIRRTLQVGTGCLDRGATRSGSEQNAPQVVGLAPITVCVERDVLLSHDHGIMQGLLVGQVDRPAGCRFAHHGPPFGSGSSMLQPANLHFYVRTPNL
jgi:hypothetical protein